MQEKEVSQNYSSGECDEGCDRGVGNGQSSGLSMSDFVWGGDERLARIEQIFGVLDINMCSGGRSLVTAIDGNEKKIVLTPDEIRAVISVLQRSINLTGSDRDAAIKQHLIDIEEQEELGISGHVYFLQGVGTNWVKIGRTECLDRRVKQISPKVPFALELVHSFISYDCVRLEAWFHKRYASCRGQGEWFALHEEVLDEIRSMVPYTEGAVPEESGYYMTMTDAAVSDGEFDHLSNEKRG